MKWCGRCCVLLYTHTLHSSAIVGEAARTNYRQPILSPFYRPTRCTPDDIAVGGVLRQARIGWSSRPMLPKGSYHLHFLRDNGWPRTTYRRRTHYPLSVSHSTLIFMYACVEKGTPGQVWEVDADKGVLVRPVKPAMSINAARQSQRFTQRSFQTDFVISTSFLCGHIHPLSRNSHHRLSQTHSGLDCPCP